MKKKIWGFITITFSLLIVLSGVASANTATFWGHTVTYSIGWRQGTAGDAYARTAWASTGGDITSQVALTIYDTTTGLNYTHTNLWGGPSGNYTYQAEVNLDSNQSTISAQSYHSVEYHNDGWSTHLYLP